MLHHLCKAISGSSFIVSFTINTTYARGIAVCTSLFIAVNSSLSIFEITILALFPNPSATYLSDLIVFGLSPPSFMMHFALFSSISEDPLWSVFLLSDIRESLLLAVLLFHEISLLASYWFLARFAELPLTLSALPRTLIVYCSLRPAGRCGKRIVRQWCTPTSIFRLVERRFLS